MKPFRKNEKNEISKNVEAPLSTEENGEEQTKTENLEKKHKTVSGFQKGATKMPWRLIKLVLILLFAIVFAAFNIDNRCGVSLIFISFQNVPVFVTMFVSFCVGIIFVLPFTIGRDSAVRKAQEAEAEVEKLKAQKAMWGRQKKMPKMKREKKSFFRSRNGRKETAESVEKAESFQKESLSEENTNE